MSGFKHGYLKRKHPSGNPALFDQFSPIIGKEQILTNDTGEVLAEKLQTIDVHPEEVDKHLNSIDVERWDIMSEALNESAKYTDITLRPGLQVIDVERDTTLKLSPVKGRTLINLIGRSNAPSAFFVRADGKSTLTFNNQDRSFTATSTGHKLTDVFIQSQVEPIVKPDTWYLAIVRARASKGSGRLRIVNLNETGGAVVDRSTNFYNTEYEEVVPLTFKTGPTIAKFLARINIDDSDPNKPDTERTSVTFRDYRIYEITEQEATAISLMSPTEIDINYPYVEGIQSVQGLYIKQTTNLAPPFIQSMVTTPANARVNMLGDYEFEFSSTGTASAGVSFDIPVYPGQKYVGSVDSVGDKVGYIRYEYYANLNLIGDRNASLSIKSPDFVPANTIREIIIPKGCYALRVFYTNQFKLDATGHEGEPGYYHFKNYAFYLNETQQFGTQSSSLITFDTELHSHVHGTEPDILFTNSDGKYLKISNWGKIRYDDPRLTFTVNHIPTSKYRKIYFSVSDITTQIYVTKYSGELLKPFNYGGVVTGDYGKDRFYVNAAGVIEISVDDNDTGWGNYAPTPEEVRAYFLGWRMCQLETAGLYNGTGTKCWGRISDPSAYIGSPGWSWYTLTVPQVPANLDASGGYSLPYQILYKRSNPIIEYVTTDGELNLVAGKNIVEVGTGMVTREPVTPTINLIGSSVDINLLNHPILSRSNLNYKADRFFQIYRDDYPDYLWNMSYWGYGYSFGNVHASMRMETFEPTSVYSVTYFKLDKSPPPILVSGKMSDNFQSQLANVVNEINDIDRRMSALETQKPVYNPATVHKLIPTLLNSWNVPDVEHPIYYYKDSNGMVYVTGAATRSTASATPVFRLAIGYRPKDVTRIAISSRSSADGSGNVWAYATITPDGFFHIQGGNHLFASFNLKFVASNVTK